MPQVNYRFTVDIVYYSLDLETTLCNKKLLSKSDPKDDCCEPIFLTEGKTWVGSDQNGQKYFAKKYGKMHQEYKGDPTDQDSKS